MSSAIVRLKKRLQMNVADLEDFAEESDSLLSV